MKVAQGKQSAALGNGVIMNIPSLHGLPCRPDGSARQTMKRGLDIGGSVTQGGSRCAPLPWATLCFRFRFTRKERLDSGSRVWPFATKKPRFDGEAH